MSDVSWTKWMNNIKISSKVFDKDEVVNSYQIRLFEYVTYAQTQHTLILSIRAVGIC